MIGEFGKKGKRELEPAGGGVGGCVVNLIRNLPSFPAYIYHKFNLITYRAYTVHYMYSVCMYKVQTDAESATNKQRSQTWAPPPLVNLAGKPLQKKDTFITR